MSKSAEGMCDTGRGTDHGEGDPLDGGTFWEGFN
jgi:hypothetical protein